MFIVRFTGKGLLVPVIPTLVLLASDLLSRWITGDPEYHANHPLLQCLCFGISAVIVWRVGTRLNSQPPPAPKHYFFALRFEQWAYVLLLAGLVIPFLKHT